MTVAPFARAFVPLAGVVLALLVPLDMEWHARVALAIATAMILCWLVELLHPAIAGFIGCFLFRAVGDVDFESAFAGFGTETPWFLYGALLLVGAANRSGLIGWLRAHTPRAFVGPLLMPAIALVVLAYALAFVVPSSLARATMLVILAKAWSHPKVPGFLGSWVPRFFGSRVPGFQSSNVPRTQEPQNLGTPQPKNLGTQEPRNLGTSEWIVLVAAYSSAMFGHPDLPAGPLSVLGWDVAGALAVVAAVVLFGGRSAHDAGAPSTGDFASLSVDFKAATPVVLAMALWLTTSLHGVPPALAGLACGLLCCLPGIAPPDWQKALKADHLAVVFAGTAISIPAVLLETSAAEGLTHLWSSVPTIPGLPENLMAYWSTTMYRIFSPDGARPALAPLDAVLGSAAIWSYSGSTLISLHQSPALILAMAVGGCRARHVLTVGLLVIILGSAVVMLF